MTYSALTPKECMVPINISPDWLPSILKTKFNNDVEDPNFKQLQIEIERIEQQPYIVSKIGLAIPRVCVLDDVNSLYQECGIRDCFVAVRVMDKTCDFSDINGELKPRFFTKVVKSNRGRITCLQHPAASHCEEMQVVKKFEESVDNSSDNEVEQNNGTNQQRQSRKFDCSTYSSSSA